jgi:hypothetical protein
VARHRGGALPDGAIQRYSDNSYTLSFGEMAPENRDFGRYFRGSLHRGRHDNWRVASKLLGCAPPIPISGPTYCPELALLQKTDSTTSKHLQAPTPKPHSAQKYKYGGSVLPTLFVYPFALCHLFAEAHFLS